MLTGLPNCVLNSSLSMFAEDIAIYHSGLTTQEVVDNVNTYLINISNWIQNNGLAINAKKTELMDMVPGYPQKLKTCLLLKFIYDNTIHPFN